MPSGYRVGGIDFDDLFDPDIVGDGPQAPGYRTSGVPLRYAAVAYGAKRANVGHSQNGVDLSNLWAAKGTAAYTIEGLEGLAVTAFEQALTFQSRVSASASLTLQSSGAWSTSSGTSSSIGESRSGTWRRTGASSDYSVRYTFTRSDTSSGVAMPAAIISNGAASYQSLGSNRTFSVHFPEAEGDNGHDRRCVVALAVELMHNVTGVVSTTRLSMAVGTAGYQ